MNLRFESWGCRRPWVMIALVIACAGCGRNAQVGRGSDETASGVEYASGAVETRPAAGERQAYRLAASVYAGWMPWYYADESGVLRSWAEREGIEIELVSMDYISSIEAFMTGQADACLVTNIDAVGLPAVAGVNTTVVIIGDYSNGNDQILARRAGSVADLKGKQVLLVELSVSDYLLSRALEDAGLTAADVHMVNTGDAKIAEEFLANREHDAVVTWHPIAGRLDREPGVRSIHDSARIPGEILDLCVVNTETLARDPRLGRALAGAWFEVLDLMQQPTAAGRAARARMAELSGCSLAEYEAQLKSTYLFGTPAEAAAFAESPELKANMELVRRFCQEKKLFGEAAAGVDAVGILYPDGTVQGSRNNVRLRFDPSFVRTVQVAAE